MNFPDNKASGRILTVVILVIFGIWLLDRLVYPPLKLRGPTRRWVAQIDADLRKGNVEALYEMVDCRTSIFCPALKKSAIPRLMVQFVDFPSELSLPVFDDIDSSHGAIKDWFDANNEAICVWLQASKKLLEFDTDSGKFRVPPPAIRSTTYSGLVDEGNSKADRIDP